MPDTPVKQNALRLRAESAEDLPALSALVQDMAVLAHDIGYDNRARRLVLIGNRFRWESPAPPTRVRSAFRIDFAQSLQHRAMPGDPTTVLALLAIAGDGPDTLLLRFANGPAIRVRVDSIDLTLEDLSAPWPARTTPAHPDDD